ncbi:DUF5362 family protein [Mucilaginibacter phyllosphaerae]|uniref:DUF5362 domain-containing protein n=1 Tax=Mucilaginibacter phyllosphaerae TaxID=1812349 RepID=A0A4Y8A9U7_9SPHI|nr:DUF5362 family protein [Mucilaginibacter phyllosphaerae]MBB3970664.1 hypothetical protein [Mucilaginibacter phyllosphaerae]TEW64667.1 hypothetical protein E2R65_16770 [Mucilaginibacter phyllosphaerae]GGH20138.1 hypothetical protein GCM10007352_31960 [Mucilaginibacter phyllosphaerae]
MEIEETIPQAAPEPQMIITEQAQYYLQKAGQWAYFLGILGFIGTVFIGLMALFVGTMFTTMAAMNPLLAGAAGMGGVVTAVYLLLAAVSFFFALYLYQFGDRIKKGITYSNLVDVTSALGKLKSFFKLWGIFSIVYIAFMILFFFAMIFVGANAAHLAQ